MLQSIGGETPLVHAIRTGNKDVAIVLLGAFSRWVNYLEDSELEKPQTRSYLKALREVTSFSPSIALIFIRCRSETRYKRGAREVADRTHSIIHADFDHE